MLQRLSSSLVKFKDSTLEKILNKLTYIEPNAVRLSDVATPGMDVTSILQELADVGGTLYQDTDFDVVTTGGVTLNKGIHIIGSRGKKGKLILTSTISDEIFNPHVTDPCFFTAQYARFKATTCLSNTPLVCGVKMIDARTGLDECEVLNCKFEDIGCGVQTKYTSESNVVAMHNHIKLSKSMADKITASGRAYMRGLLHTDKRDKDTVYTVDAKRYGSGDISHNIVEGYIPTGANQDLAKFSGFYRSLKVTNNHFHNVNLDSKAEVDTYNGVGGGVYGFNTHVNCSLKVMSLINSGGPEYLASLGVSLVGNNLTFEDGHSNNYGMYFKSDVSTATGNVIRTKVNTARNDFTAVWQDGRRGGGGYLGCQEAVGLTFTGNVIDMGADNLAGYNWRAIEAPSQVIASIWSSNVIKGGSIRKVINENSLFASNQIINTSWDKGAEMLFHTQGNVRSNVSNGVWSNGAETTVTATKGGEKNTVTIPSPWIDGELALWTLMVRSSSSKGNNWQVFDVMALPQTQTIANTAGRLALDTSSADSKNLIFDMVVTGGNVTLQSKGSTSDDVTVTYKWVNVVR